MSLTPRPHQQFFDTVQSRAGGFTVQLMSEAEAKTLLKWDNLEGVLRSLWKTHEDDRLGYLAPQESHSQTILANRLALYLCEGSEFWVYFTGWGAYPSASNEDLFYGYRSGHGDRRSLFEAPVYVFSSEDEDIDRFTSIVGMALYFRWDAWIFNADKTYLIAITNDRTVEVFAESSEFRVKLITEFTRLGMEHLNAT